MGETRSEATDRTRRNERSTTHFLSRSFPSASVAEWSKALVAQFLFHVVSSRFAVALFRASIQGLRSAHVHHD